MTVSVDTSAVRQKLARTQQGPTGNRPEARKATSAEATVRQLLERMKPEIAKALPSHMSAERLARIVYTEIRRNPELMECERTSLLGAVMLSAQLGLEQGPLGHCYLVPHNNKKLGRK